MTAATFTTLDALRSTGAIEASSALSPLQEGMLFQSLLEPGAGHYVVQHLFAIDGPLDPVMFRHAWDSLVRRHAILRSAIVWDLGAPIQAVAATADLRYEELDWRDRPQAHAERGVDAEMERERAEGIDVSVPPAMRVRLFRTGEDRWLLAWSVHHALLDGWSKSILLAELSTIYRAERRGLAPDLDLPVPFSRFISWLRRQPSEPAAEFWRDELRDLPSQRAHSRLDAAEVGRAAVEWPDGLAGRVRDFAARTRVTRNTVCQGAVGLHLARIHGAAESVVGAVVSCRPPALAGAGRIVGPCINTLPVRIDVPSDAPIDAWLERLQRRHARARGFSGASLAEIHGWTGIPGDATPVRAVLAFENYPGSSDRTGLALDDNVRMAFLRAYERNGFPLSIIVTDAPTGTVQVTTEAGEVDAIDLAGGIVDVIQDLVSGRHRRVGDVGRPRGSRRRQLLEGWNDTGRTYPQMAIHDLFRQQALDSPAAVAIKSATRTLTYAELDARSDEVAGEIVRAGVVAGDRVGLLLERSALSIVATLAVLKTGAAYVPIDPDTPPRRIREMASLARVALIVTDQHRALGDDEARVLVLNDGAFDTPEAPRDGSQLTPRWRSVGPDDLAYVAFTSGSTGVPKGVAVPHRAVVRLVRNSEFVPLGEHTCMLHHSNVAFDAATLELWGPLLNGGTCVPVQATLLSPSKLAEQLRLHGVTHLWLTAAYFNLIADEDPSAVGTADYLLCGGDQLSTPHVQRVRSHANHLTLVNGYGPTETTTFATTHQIRSDQPLPARIPIGLPIANTSAHVVDEDLELVDIGTEGELCVGGAGVAWGYLDHPSDTACSFVPDPYSSIPGSRLYRTGDVVRRLPNGDLEFLGRRDEQVKIRGFRIEPAEVEAAIREHAVVGDAAVTTHRRDAGGLELVAHVVMNGGGVDLRDLRHYLESRLPDHMVPAFILAVDALPLTPSGKVDRRALPDPPTRAARPLRQPSTLEEVELCSALAEILHLPSTEIAIDSSFHDLGGDSLHALRLVARMAQAFDVELPLRSVFESSSLSDLAAELSEMRGAD